MLIFHVQKKQSNLNQFQRQSHFVQEYISISFDYKAVIILYCNIIDNILIEKSKEILKMNPELITAKEREKIQIFIRGKDYAIQHKFESYLVVKYSIKDSSLDKEILKTKAYKEDTSPNYQEDCILDFLYEKHQCLQFILYVNNTKWATISGVLLYNVFKNKTGELKFKNQKNEEVGSLFVHSSIYSTKDEDRILEGSIQMKTPCIKLSEKYMFKFLRWDYNQIKKEEVCLEVYRSNQVLASSQEVEWSSFKISENRLSLKRDSSKIEIAFYRYSAMSFHTLIGKAEIDLDDLKRGVDYQIYLNDRKVGTYAFTTLIRKHNESFLGYMQNGLEINSVISIDFTESNKHFSFPNSNHCISTAKDSKYEEIIRKSLDPILEHDKDKMVPVFGFGCTVNHEKIKTGAKLSPMFPINMDVNNPCLRNFDEIKKAYRECMPYLKFSGPTYFGPLIKWAVEEGKQYQKNTDHYQYMIMFILTDGQLCDEQKVTDLIVECSSLPISIVIIGIGNEDFSRMREFDQCELIDSKGKRTLRDLVKFVQYQKFKDDQSKLSEQILEEIPRHVESYFALKKKEKVK